MQILTHEQQQEIMKFIRLTGLNNFPDADTSEQEFLNDTYRFHTIIEAYGGCAEHAATAYNKAVLKAVETVKDINDDIPNEQYSIQAKSVFASIMRDEFYLTYIQYCWQQLKTYQRKTSVLDQGLYQGYLNAAQDIDSYVDYTVLPAV